MKKRTIILALTILLATLAIAFISGCSRIVVIEGIAMKDTATIETAIGDFSYDGVKVVVYYQGGEQREIDLTEDMIPEDERLKFYKVGEHEVKVVYNGRYVTTMKVKVDRHVFEDIYELNGYVCTYDGKPHRVELNHELPEGAKIEFKYGNTFTNAGTYNVVGVISKDGYVSKTLTAQLVITKAVYDLSEMEFADVTTVYDGSIKTIEVTGVPDGVRVTYDVYQDDIRINNAVNAGRYTVVARFEVTNGNYESIRNKRATLTVNKADYDMSAVTLENVTKTFDGTEYTPSLSNSSVLPQGVTVSYAVYKDGNKVTSNAAAGVYEVKASFKGSAVNYNAIDDLTAVLTVNQRVIAISDKFTFVDKTVNFDRKAHSLKIDGELPTTVEVEYENNDRIYAGDYEVIARFKAKDDNYTVDVKEARAYLIINKIRESVTVNGREITGEDLFYDADKHTMTLVGLDADVYSLNSLDIFDGDGTKIEWETSALVDGEAYRYLIKFKYNDDNVDNSVLLSDSSGTYTYKKMVFDGAKYVYDGTVKTIAVENIPDGMEARYEAFLGDDKVDETKNAGDYRIKATIFRAETEIAVYEMFADLTIEKYRYDTTGMSFDDAEYVYDGTQKTCAVQNAPEGVPIIYSYIKGDEIVPAENVVNVGEYEVTAHFAVDEVNCYAIADVKATLEIQKATVSAALTDKKFKSDGNAYMPSFDEGYFIPYGASYEFVITKDGEKKDSCDGLGLFVVEAHFEIDDENVNPQEDLSAEIFIYSIQLEGVVQIEDIEETFDLWTYPINANMPVKNLPSNVNVTYEYYKGDEFIGENVGVKYAGTYKVIERFTPKDPNDVLDMYEAESKIVINKRTVQVEGQLQRNIQPSDFWYNPDTKTLDLRLLRGTGTVSTFFTIKSIRVFTQHDKEVNFGPIYSGFDESNDQLYNYVVEFDIDTDDADYYASVEVANKKGTFKYADITKGKLVKIAGVVSMKGIEVDYDGEVHKLELQNFPHKSLSESVTVTYEYYNKNKALVSTDGVKDVGEYTVIARFSTSDENATLEVEELSAKLIIRGDNQ